VSFQYNPHKYEPPHESCQQCGMDITSHFAKCRKCGMIFTQGIVHKCKNKRIKKN